MSSSLRPRTRTVVRLTATVLLAVALAATTPGVAAADEAQDEPWQLRTLGAASAWQQTTGRDVTVAVVDSGVDASHPALAGRVLPGIDLVTAGGDGHTDPVGHGTSVASFIVGRADDGDGVAGLAPGAKILPVRVLDDQNRYADAMIVAKGVQWAVDHGAQVINLSLGGASYSGALADALDYAFANNVVVVACTGNVLADQPRQVWYPAREPGVVAVAGLAGDQLSAPDPLWSGSLTGTDTVLTAPATNLLGARPGGGYWRVQGTSFAAPLVSATAALIRAKWPTMSAPNVVQRLIRTARDLGPTGRDDRYGFGVVDPVLALRAPVAEVVANPLDNAPAPGVARFGAADEAAFAESAADQAAVVPVALDPRTGAASRSTSRTPYLSTCTQVDAARRSPRLQVPPDR